MSSKMSITEVSGMTVPLVADIKKASEPMAAQRTVVLYTTA